ncbi:hypothetical protein [Bradyrhizobium sp. STM 3566]|uniref:hypothetical protein n=1 Tax=Bradyrhizobium sp. STM 3566 TaxID=578928 RepID=UPI00388EAFA6
MSTGEPLDAAEPKVLVFGDSIIDWLIYDKRSEDAEKALAWTSPLSRDDWHYSAGFEMHQCVAGAAAIHAMLCENNIPVNGNAFKADLRKPDTGSIFVLKKRANAGKNKEERTRAYLKMLPTGQSWQAFGTSNKHADDREETWRVTVSLLSDREKAYVEPCNFSNAIQPNAVRTVCLWDVGRGCFHVKEENKKGDWEKQQSELFGWYMGLSSKPPIVIRTSDPSRFEAFLLELARLKDRRTVVLVCALTQLDDGNLRGSGTWSDVWALVYDYLNRKHSYLFDSALKDWRFHVLIPVYEDGVIWIGPDCWPIKREDQNEEALRDDKLPLGRLFAVPGAQPGLSEFEEHSRTIGVHTLLVHAIVEQLVEQLAAEPKDANFAFSIRQGLMRATRLRSRGYCDPKELIKVKGHSDYNIGFPREVWKKECREATDLLLRYKTPCTDQTPCTKQFAGPYEVQCKFSLRESKGLRIFTTMEKEIDGEFVASPKNCIFVVQDFKEIPDLKKRIGKRSKAKTARWTRSQGRRSSRSRCGNGSQCSLAISRWPTRPKPPRFSTSHSGSGSMSSSIATTRRRMPGFSTSRCLAAPDPVSRS